MKAGIIFDYGGTLDTGGRHWARVFWSAYQRHQVPVSEQQFREAYVHAERFLGRTPVIQPSFTFRQVLAEKLKLQMEYLQPGTSTGVLQQTMLDELYSMVQAETARSREVLMRLKASWPLVLVSNFYGNLPTVLREFSLDGLFHKVVESAVVGVRKPDTRIFLLGAEALGLQPAQVTVVGDSLDKDILPASKAGFRTIWFRGESWGNESTVPEGTCQIASLEELITNKDSLFKTRI